MALLDELGPGIVLNGLLPHGLVTVVNVTRHGSIGAGSSYTNHEDAEKAGSGNEGAGAGAGGLLGATGILGRGGLNL